MGKLHDTGNVKSLNILGSKKILWPKKVSRLHEKYTEIIVIERDPPVNETYYRNRSNL